MIECSIEKLYHFDCQGCHQVFSIGDYHLIQENELSCPQCKKEIDASLAKIENLYHFKCVQCNKWWTTRNCGSQNTCPFC